MLRAKVLPPSGLRAFFDELVELAPPQRAARLARLELTYDANVQLQAMLAFDDVAALAAEQAMARIAALDLPPAVAERVLKMLARDRSMPAQLHDDVAAAIQHIGADDDAALGHSLIGTQIGTFRLVELIGQGGSSAVFRAERQAGAGAQTVALKLLRTGLYSATEQRRFRREQAILAQLTHPNIARLVEAGVSSAGIPYIAMELVDGLPLTEAADARALDLPQRLRWFVQLCRTVEAAHAALIVHRDLKPSNLLVTADGTLKVLDFGIAKLVDEDVHATRTQSVAFTPGYAAPEQFGTGPPTTAIDVYALGVVLGELLTGQRLDGGRRASDAVTSGEDGPPRGLPARGALARTLRRDLDGVLLCAMAEEPQQRYRSAGELADDIERHLSGHPVRAYPPGRWYSAQKFVRRHHRALALMTLLVLGLLGAIALVSWQARRAELEARHARSTLDFLLHVFTAAEPAGPRLGPPTVADVVRNSIAEAQQTATLAPAVRIELIDALGTVLRKQGERADSLRLLERNYHEAQDQLGARDPVTLQAGLGLAQALSEAELSPQARPLLDALLARSINADDQLRARLFSASAQVGTTLFERERALDESAHAVALCTHCDERVRILALITRGDALASFADEAAAIPVLEEALTAQRRLLGNAHVELADTLDTLSRAYRRRGDLAHAEALAREAVAIVEASLPDPHQRRVSALDALRQVLIDAGRLDEAVELGQRIIALDERIYSPAHVALATDQNTLGYTYLMRDEFALAAQHFRSALDIADALPDYARRAAIYRANLGNALGRAGDTAAGERLIRAALATFRAQADVDYGEVTSATEKLGELQRLAGDLDGALATFEQADADYRRHLPTAPAEWHARTLIGIGRTLCEQHADAARAERTLREALAKTRLQGRPFSPLRIEAGAALASLLFERGETAAAEVLLRSAQGEAESAPHPLPNGVRELLQRAAQLDRSAALSKRT